MIWACSYFLTGFISIILAFQTDDHEKISYIASGGSRKSKAGLVPHGFVVGKKRKEKKREMERTRSRLVKMSGWNEVRRVDEMISNGSGFNIYDRRRENDRSE